MKHKMNCTECGGEFNGVGYSTFLADRKKIMLMCQKCADEREKLPKRTCEYCNYEYPEDSMEGPKCVPCTDFPDY